MSSLLHFFLMLFSHVALTVTKDSKPVVIGCYFASVSARPLGFKVTDIPVENCTHIIHGYGDVDEDAFILNPLQLDYQEGYKEIRKSSDVKLLMGVGGPELDGGWFSKMADHQDTRQKFINSTIEVLQENKMDGINLLWMWAARKDRDNLVQLVKDFRRAYNPLNLLVTATVPMNETLADDGYDVCELTKNLDQIHVMGFDLRGAWNKVANVHSPLLGNGLTVESGMTFWSSRTLPPYRSKLILIVSFYGSSLTLQNSDNHGVNAPLDKEFPFGESTKLWNRRGYAAYSEICQAIESGNLTEDWDDEGKAPFAYCGTYWVGYENKRSLELKVQHVKDNEFGGIIMYSVAFDDFNASCGSRNQLSSVIKSKLHDYMVPVSDENPECVNPLPVSKTIMIAGSVTAVLCFSCFAVYCWWRKRRNSKTEETDLRNWMHEWEFDRKFQILQDRGKLLDTNDITMYQRIGSGNFGCVFLADLIVDSVTRQRQRVAVKTLNTHNVKRIEYDAFIKEAVSMRDFDHDNVLPLIGLSFKKSGEPLLIIPFMQNGELLSYLCETRNVLTVFNLLSYGLDVAKGMEYLSTMKFVHRDLAARNCLLDENFTVKIADFGLSRDVYQNDYYKPDGRSGQIPIKWMAPETIRGERQSYKSDVWSFGVLLWEIMTRGMIPYAAVNNAEILSHIESGNRLEKPAVCPLSVYQLMQQCWQVERNLRPSFREVREILFKVLTMNKIRQQNF